MAYKISDACIKCGQCAANCPVQCISEEDTKYVIDVKNPNSKSNGFSSIRFDGKVIETNEIQDWEDEYKKILSFLRLYVKQYCLNNKLFSSLLTG